ncbi:MAG: DNA gyrase subunit A [Candidatus Shapirobacteria bacterium]|nr:DNA gyrase subunit A [Candidatus Shapirobacteria bacterium]
MIKPNSSQQTDPDSNNRIQDTQISQEVKSSYLDYAMSVIVARALPDVRDGLKPVHRRILYAMHRVGLSYKSAYSKSAKVVGEVLGKYHPHGDSPVYEAMVRLAQEFSMRYPLIQGQGNFGSVDGDSPAAMRYTEARLAKIAQEMLQDLDKDTVPFAPNFDGSLEEPEYLPAILPNLLIMGSEGIAVGMATKIPPHNLVEVCQAIIATIDKSVLIDSEKRKALFSAPKSSPKKNSPLVEKLISINPNQVNQYLPQVDSDISLDEILQYIKGPDFPTAGVIFGQKEIRETYVGGRGKILIRGQANIEETSNGRFQIVIRELPYQVNKANLVAKIAQLVREQKIKGVSDLRDESDRDGIRVAIDLSRDSRPQSVLNNLFKKTDLETSFPVNIVALVDKIPQTLGLRAIINLYISHRQETITRRVIYNLKSARHRGHILEGLKIALDHLDEVIKTIRSSANTDIARKQLMEKFGLSQIQANAILDMQLKSLSRLERDKVEKEYQEILAKIKRLTGILIEPKKALAIIKKELNYLIKSYPEERRTMVVPHLPDELSQEDLIPNKNVIITITKEGYIKRMPKNVYKSQRRGGKGITGMSTKEEDTILELITANTHDQIIFFTDQGRAFATKVWEIPEGNRQSKGKAIINLVNIDSEEKINATLKLSKTDKKNGAFLLLATSRGTVKKTALSEFDKIRANGLIAMKLKKDDRLVWAKIVLAGDHVLLATTNGQSIRFPEKEIRATARDTMGVSGIDLKEDDRVVSCEVFAPQSSQPEDKRRKFFRNLLIVTQRGLGKQTDLKLFPIQHRNGKGVKIANINKKTGPVAAVKMINQNDETAIITSQKAQVIKLPTKNIPKLGRNTQGVILMRFKKAADYVASLTTLKKIKKF